MKPRLPSLPVLLAVLLPAVTAFWFLAYLISGLPSEEDTRVRRARDDLRALRSVLLLGGKMPDTKAGLEALVLRGDIPFLPKDPWGRPYQYRNPGKAYAYELFSLGADGVESGDDVIAWNLYGGR
ncbi:MAG: type II secretion system protein GspG [Zoogloeaceae bacterium]|jgi:general secretion pathway protein G|nr:type II secretion system protein GspG [Zoogloeaceae bacterium]